ncbi:MAG TPA: fluoride efflux transporter CrcB [Flavobacteriaceae bacterium]|nr:fluoride efflux transporter CrcB [Flavobacteriaceae bacterium]
MKQLLLVFLGGGMGSALRFLVSKYLNSTSGGFPYGTFTVNLLGSLLIGIVLGLSVKNQALTSHQTLLLAAGFCGGFTTFSAFAHENYLLLKSGDFTLFALYTLGSLVLGVLAVFGGMYLVK